MKINVANVKSVINKTENGEDKMSKKEVEMDITDVELVRDSIGQIELIGNKYNIPTIELFNKINSLEKVKV